MLNEAERSLGQISNGKTVEILATDKGGRLNLGRLRILVAIRDINIGGTVKRNN